MLHSPNFIPSFHRREGPHGGAPGKHEHLADLCFGGQGVLPALRQIFSPCMHVECILRGELELLETANTMK